MDFSKRRNVCLCKGCGAEVRPGMVRCRECNTPISESLSHANSQASYWEQIFSWETCPRCGADVRAAMLSCRKCGYALRGAGAAHGTDNEESRTATSAPRGDEMSNLTPTMPSLHRASGNEVAPLWDRLLFQAWLRWRSAKVCWQHARTTWRNRPRPTLEDAQAFADQVMTAAADRIVDAIQSVCKRHR